MSGVLSVGDVVVCIRGITFPWGECIAEGKKYKIEAVHEDGKVSVEGVVTPTYPGRFAVVPERLKDLYERAR